MGAWGKVHRHTHPHPHLSHQIGAAARDACPKRLDVVHVQETQRLHVQLLGSQHLEKKGGKGASKREHQFQSRPLMPLSESRRFLFSLSVRLETWLSVQVLVDTTTHLADDRVAVAELGDQRSRRGVKL